MTVTADRQIDAAQASLERATRHLLSLQQPERLVEGRARDQRHDRRRGPVPPPLPRPPRAGARRQRPRPGSAAAAARRTGRGRPTTAGPATCRPPSRRTSRSGSPATRPRPRTCGAPRHSSAKPAGSSGTRVFTRMWLSLLGLWSWADVPTLPPEQILLPSAAPLSIYSFGCWARQTIVALSIVTALAAVAAACRSASTSCDGAAVAAGPLRRCLGTGVPRCSTGPATPTARRPVGRAAPPRAAHGRALDRRAPGARRLVGRHPAAVGLVDRGARTRSATALDHPVLARGARRASSASRSRTSSDRRLEACQSPVWDTALAVIALLDAGVAAGRPRHRRGRCEWLAAQEVSTRGRLGGPSPEARTRRLPVRVRERELPRRRRHRRRRARAPPSRARPDAEPLSRGLAWMLGMQSRSAARAPSTSTTTSRLCARLAFCDFGAVTDPPSADVTAHVLETLAYEGRAGERPARARARLAAARAGARRLVVRALGRELRLRHGRRPAGARRLRPRRPRERPTPRVRWLEARAEPGRWIRGGPPVVPRPLLERPRRLDRVADGVGAARAARGRRAPAAGGRERAVPWLVETQRPTAAGTSRSTRAPASRGDFYLNYHLYRDVFPVMALGRGPGRRRG